MDAPETETQSATTHPSDRFKLVADISIFHYQRLKTVAGDRGIPVGQLVEELIDRMWTYRGRQD